MQTYVADGVLSDVDTVLEDTLGAWLAWCRCSAVGNDLVWCGLDVVLRVEVEQALALLPLITLPLALPVFITVLLILVLVVVGLVVVCVGGRGGYSNRSAQDREKCGGGEMHDDRFPIF
jgi:hypothetical protein